MNIDTFELTPVSDGFWVAGETSEGDDFIRVLEITPRRYRIHVNGYYYSTCRSYEGARRSAYLLIVDQSPQDMADYPPPEPRRKRN